MAFLEGISKVHVIGAGGIGVSAVAKLLASQGRRVSGSDLGANEATQELSDAGIPVAIGHAAANVPADADLVIYSSAVPEDNPERQEASRRGIRQMSYFEFLGDFSKSKWTIAVSGTNGKSTTTALLGLILERAGLDPTVIVGSKVRTFPEKNLRLGNGKYFVVEACEHQANMLKLFPQMIVLTNIEEDHLDFYGDLAHIRKAFQRYIEKLPLDGTLVLNADDPVSSAELKPKTAVVTYGLDEPADYAARGLLVGSGRQAFDVVRRADGRSLGKFSLAVPGRFNVANVLAATAAAAELGVPPAVIREAVADFRGIWRRFERVGERNGAAIFSDYGHTPTPVAGTIQAAREFFPGSRIILAFQPHHRNRTRRLFDDFVVSFDNADELVLCEVYDVAGREDAADAAVSSRQLVEAVKERDARRGISRQVEYAASPAQAAELLKREARAGDVVIIMGAGDIYRIAEQLKSDK
jgi:UDP-N-acetylmuramate--alanine ligase